MASVNKIYKDEAGEWRWQIKSLDNGEIIAASSKGSNVVPQLYKTR